MKNRIGSSGFLALGILIGFLIFFLSYWYIGSMNLSFVIALIAGGGVIVAKSFGYKPTKKEGKR
jgi:hypothetical protein